MFILILQVNDQITECFNYGFALYQIIWFKENMTEGLHHLFYNVRINHILCELIDDIWEVWGATVQSQQLYFGLFNVCRVIIAYIKLLNWFNIGLKLIGFDDIDDMFEYRVLYFGKRIINERKKAWLYNQLYLIHKPWISRTILQEYLRNGKHEGRVLTMHSIL